MCRADATRLWRRGRRCGHAPVFLPSRGPPGLAPASRLLSPRVRGASHTRLAARDRPRCLRTRPPMLLSPSSGAVVPPRAGPCSGAHPWAASLRLRGLPVCGRDSPSARGGATSQLVTSEAHVQRRGPAAGDRAGGGRRGCPSEAASARVPMSRPPARLQTRGAPSPSSSVAGCSPLGGRLEAPPQRRPAQREPRLPQLPAGYGERAGGGGGGSLSPSPGLRGSEARPAARQWKCCPFACFWAATM